MFRGKKSTAPEAGVNWLSRIFSCALAQHDHVGREILRFATQPVAEPCPETRLAQLHCSSVDESNGWIVVDSLRVHRSHDADLVSNLLSPRQEIGDPGACWSALPDRGYRFGDRKILHAGGHAGDTLFTFDLRGQVLSVVLDEEGGSVKEVNVRGAA